MNLKRTVHGARHMAWGEPLKVLGKSINQNAADSNLVPCTHTLYFIPSAIRLEPFAVSYHP
jgi:hypothetical protein